MHLEPELLHEITFRRIPEGVLETWPLAGTCGRALSTSAIGMVPLLFPGLSVGDLPSGAYFLFEVNFFLRSTYMHVGRILLQQRGVDFRPFLTLQPDFMPFTFYIAFPEPTWVSILQRFTLRGYFQILSGDVPWTLDADGTALLNLNFSPRSALLFLLLNLSYHHQRGRDFAHGIAHFVVLGFQMRYSNFMRMMTSGRFWNRQHIDFLLKVGDLSISDPLELASMVTMTSPPGESLWNLCALYHGQTSRGYTWSDIHLFGERCGMNLFDFMGRQIHF